MPSIGRMLAYFSYVTLMFFLPLFLAPVRQGEPGGEAGESPETRRQSERKPKSATHRRIKVPSPRGQLTAPEIFRNPGKCRMVCSLEI